MTFVTGRAVPNCQCKGQCPAIELTHHPYTAHRKRSVRLWANHQSEEQWLPEMKSSDGDHCGQTAAQLILDGLCPTLPVCGRLALLVELRNSLTRMSYESTSGSSGWHRQSKRRLVVYCWECNIIIPVEMCKCGVCVCDSGGGGQMMGGQGMQWPGQQPPQPPPPQQQNGQ